MYHRLMLIALMLICASASGQVTMTGSITSHIDSIIAASPTDAGIDQDKYVEPTTTGTQTWRQIIQAMLSGDHAAAHTLAGTIDYRVVQFTDTPPVIDQVYWVLERTPGSTTNYWGTFVFNPSPSRSRLVIQAPHPLQNLNTGNQSIRVYTTADAWIFCLAGAHKCNSTSYSPCSGTSTSCADSSEPYRLGDQAHASSATFEITTEELLAYRSNAIVIQPHGYTKGDYSAEDPDIIMSNGSQLTPATEYLAPLKAKLLLQDNTLTFKIAHVDLAYNYYLGQDNVQGRLINGSADPCDQAATANTGQFLHLEQAYAKLRDTEANWYKLADAVAQTFAPDVQITSAQSGSWSSAVTWAGGIVPTMNDPVVIAAGHTISIDDNFAECQSISFGDTASHIDLNAKSTLSVYGNFTLFSQVHNVFSAGWSSDSAFVRFAGGATQTLYGWSTSAGCTAFRDIIVDKDSGTVLTTSGTNCRFGIQNSLDIKSGKFVLATDDELEARWASSAALTGDQNLKITVEPNGEFRLVNDGASGVHWIRSNTGSVPIGKMTVYGYAEFTDASSSDISIAGIDVKAGGTVELGLSLYTSTSGAMFNPGTITVDSGGNIYSTSTSNLWFDTSIVILNPGGTYKTTGSSTIFPTNFTNNGKVRYQRDPSTASDQNVVDRDYKDVEFSFAGGSHRKLWALTAPRMVTDSFIVNNSATVYPSAASAQTLTINNTLRLTSGTLDNTGGNVTISMADGSLISRATGTMTSAPSFAGVCDVKYTSSATSVTTGKELPTSSSALRDLQIFTSDQIVTLGADAVVNGALTLSAGTFDNNGADDDYTLNMADGSTIRRASAALTAAPGFAGVVDVEYISTVSPAITAFEIPTGTAVLRNLTITGDKGVTLGSNATVNGAVVVNGSDLSTDGYTLTLAQTATLTETNGFGVLGNIATSRTMAQSTAETFGGLGISINAAGGVPGVTNVTRVTGQPQVINWQPKCFSLL